MKIMQLIRDIRTFMQYGDLPTSYYIKRGMKVGKNFNRQSGTRLDPNNCWLIDIGDDVIMSNKCQIVAHDFSMMHYTGYAAFGPVKIGNRVFIGANSTILMNVIIGDDVIIGAGSLVNKNVPDGCVVAGVPARIICKTYEYVERHSELIKHSPKLDKSDTYYGGKSIKKSPMHKIYQSHETRYKGVFYAKFRNVKHVIGNDDTSPVTIDPENDN